MCEVMRCSIIRHDKFTNVLFLDVASSCFLFCFQVCQVYEVFQMCEVHGVFCFQVCQVHGMFCSRCVTFMECFVSGVASSWCVLFQVCHVHNVFCFRCVILTGCSKIYNTIILY